MSIDEKVIESVDRFNRIYKPNHEISIRDGKRIFKAIIRYAAKALYGLKPVVFIKDYKKPIDLENVIEYENCK